MAKDEDEVWADLDEVVVGVVEDYRDDLVVSDEEVLEVVEQEVNDKSLLHLVSIRIL